MLVNNAIQEIRLKINDRDRVGLDDGELLNHLNDAIQYITSALIAYKAPFKIKDVEATEKTFPLPTNFAQWCGTFPVKITGNNVEVLEEPPIKLRYFEGSPDITASGDMPFHINSLNRLAIKLACIYAQNQEHEEISQDKALQGELQQIIAASMGVGG